jgi:D-alanine--poly(phosphoribitol) ligase subunit 1
MLPSSIAELWDTQCTKHLHSNALAGSGQEWTYQQLDRYSRAIARTLLQAGIERGDVVGIFNSKHFISYAAMLSCVRLGVIYTNIDSQAPVLRNLKILKTCQPRLLLADEPLQEELEKSISSQKIKLLQLNPDHFQALDDNFELVLPALTWTTPAYIMFTSGSTGFPKGVTITHGGLLSFISWSVDYFEVTPNDRFAQLSPMYFDNSVFDFYTALFSGACLVPVPRETFKNPLQLLSYVEEMRCTVWFSVPSLWIYILTMRALRRDALPDLRLTLFGGEGFPKSELKKLYDIFSDRVRFSNVYGPTEGTCICSAYDIAAVDFEDMQTLAPLGKINPNFSYLIVDNQLSPVPVGEKGELLLLGPNLSSGYFNDSDRTKELFIQNPVNRSFSERAYKTGDLVYEQNGLLWFSGRLDNQIKHMGYRIELEEIEAALHSLDVVQQAGVVYQRVRERYGRIVAFVDGSEGIDEEQLIKQLRSILPAYMIPERIVFLESLPKNANGKVDRKALEGGGWLSSPRG